MKRCSRFGAPPRHCEEPGLVRKTLKLSGHVAPKPSLLQRAAGEGAITDAVGLRRAYQQGDAYTHGSSLYVAGSWTMRDWYDDATKVPFWGDTREAHRYKMAQKALAANPQITRVVGHSLGGAVALEMQKQRPQLKSRTFGAPVWDLWGNDRRNYDMAKYRQGGPERPERFRSAGDPISFFDASSTTYLSNPFTSLSGPHAYGPIAEATHSEGTAATQNPDSSVSITE